MNPSLGLASLALAVALATGSSGCKGDSCASTDLDCFVRHMILVEPVEDGAPMELVEVDASRIKGSGGQPVPQCGPALTLCADFGGCADLRSDPNNCGSCGASCAPPQTCVSKICGCPHGGAVCNGGCVDTNSDPSHCGGCNTPCPSGLCSQGNCVPACPGGLVQCGASCVDTQGSDAFNCGGCGQTCGADQVCNLGACGCAAGSTLCAAGCTDSSSDPTNCGACGVACGPGQECSAEACVPSGGGTGAPPSFTDTPPPMTFPDPQTLQELDLGFQDPQGCTPTVCGSLCMGTECSKVFMCSRPKKDHLTSGVWRSYLGFLAEPTGEPARFTGELVPVSSDGCPDDLPEQLEAGDTTVEIGVEVTFEIEIELPSDASSSSSGSGSSGGVQTQCSDEAPTCNCQVRACATSDQTCWYETSNGTFNCGPNCDCGQAAQNVVASCCPQ